ncbi:MAG: hypothetical protein K8S56_06235 [Candidatus Cloacimonetes bacterium]|nr:hypothetical protein [Candidatus Cloacimonadota bacterium]
MILLIYNLLLYLLLPVIVLIVVTKSRKGELSARLWGTVPDSSQSIWIHCASVGEVNAVKPLIVKLRELYTDLPIVISTMTITGRETAQNIHSELSAFILPLDYPHLMRNTFKKLNPRLLIIIETELWPNMLSLAGKKNIPVVIINGRMSEKSHNDFEKSMFLWRRPFKAIRMVGAQTRQDADYYSSLGICPAHYTGNLKFALNLPEWDINELRSKYGYTPDDFICVFGSTRPGEELLLIKTICQLNLEMDIKTVIVPRHLERLEEIVTHFREAGFNPALTSRKETGKLLIVDEMGILTSFYALADICLIGGSFTNFGGHNPLESAFYGKPILIGPHHHSCRHSVEQLKINNAIHIVEGSELPKAIRFLYHHPEERQEMGMNARQTLIEHADSLDKNLELLKSFLRIRR